jgi:hypothetical protein
MSNEVRHKEIAQKFLIALRSRNWDLLKAILTKTWSGPYQVRV